MLIITLVVLALVAAHGNPFHEALTLFLENNKWGFP